MEPPCRLTHGTLSGFAVGSVMGMSIAIETVNLVKTFGRTRALDGLNLQVQTGEVHGFLGPNGAGKTTTLRVLLGLLRADSGTTTVLGGDPWRDLVALHCRLAYVPGDVALWSNLTGGEVIDLLGLPSGNSGGVEVGLGAPSGAARDAHPPCPDRSGVGVPE
jgi:ABC-2 type transport system ATP-binding protein